MMWYLIISFLLIDHEIKCIIGAGGGGGVIPFHAWILEK